MFVLKNGGRKTRNIFARLRAEKSFDYEKSISKFMLVYNLFDIKKNWMFTVHRQGNADLNTKYYKDSDIVGTNTIAHIT